MKTKNEASTIERIDIFRNKFLEVKGRMIEKQFSKALRTEDTCDYVLVPRQSFMIISENESSPRKIVFENWDDYGELLGKKNIFKFLEWEQCCIWDFGGDIELVIREDDPSFVDLKIRQQMECLSVVNIMISYPFIKIMHDKLFRVVNNIDDDDLPKFIEVQMTELDHRSFVEVKKPVQVWKRK